MLTFMRKHANSWFIKILLAMIVVTFVGFFGWSAVQGPFVRDVVATVDGEPISLGEYQTAYQETYELYRRIYGNALSEEVVRGLQLGRQALERIIRARLQVREAHKAGLQVSDQELARHIADQAAFQRDGRFDRAVYQEVLRRNRLSVAAYESEERKNLLFEKLQALIRDGVKTTQPEVEEAFRWSEEQAKVRYLVFPPEKLKDRVKVDEEKLATFFEKEKERFRFPRKIRVDYLFADLQEMEKDVRMTDADVARAYEARKAEFKEPERRVARHILLKLGPNASAEQVAAVRGKTEETLRRLRGGADFAAVAKEVSEDPSAVDNGGNLGDIRRGELDPDFEKAVFDMKAGELRGPVRTGFGFHIIRLEAVKPAKVKTLEEVKAPLADGLRAERAAEQARNAIEKVWDEAVQGRNFADIPLAKGVRRGESDFFSADGKGLALPDAAAVARAAFRLSQDGISDPIEGEAGWYVVRVRGVQASRLPGLKEVRQAVEAAYVAQESERLAADRAKELVKEINGGKSLDSVAQREGLQAAESPFFTRRRPIPSLNMEASFYREAFDLARGQAGEALSRQGPVVFVVLERRPADVRELEKDGGKFRREYLESKQRLVLNKWLENVRQAAEVTIRPELRQQLNL